MRIFVPKEAAPGEKRAPLVPETAKKLAALGAEVAVETGIGASIYRSDTEYKNAGASVVDDRWVGLADADVVLRLQKPPINEVAPLREGLQDRPRVKLVKRLPQELHSTLFPQGNRERMVRSHN